MIVGARFWRFKFAQQVPSSVVDHLLINIVPNPFFFLASQFNLLCIRHAEFGRSLAVKKLQRAASKYNVYYMAILRETQKDVVDSIEEMVYQAWDGSATAPPKTRPREAAQEPRLGTILWQDGRPIFPTTLLSKFAEDTDHRSEVLKLKEKLE